MDVCRSFLIMSFKEFESNKANESEDISEIVEELVSAVDSKEESAIYQVFEDLKSILDPQK